MGEVGVALADDESVLFYNPAGLGVPRNRWRGGAATYFYEPLLPALGINDLWHAAGAICYQPPWPDDMGGIGIMANYLSFGRVETEDAFVVIDGQVRSHLETRSWEGVLALAWGFNLLDLGIVGHSFGVAAKVYKSALVPGFGPHDEGIGRGLAFDLGYLYIAPIGVRFGATLQNVGPPVFYVDWDNADPIPFTVNLACGFKRKFRIGSQFPVQVAAEYRLDREIVKSYDHERPDPFFKAIYTDLTSDEPRRELEEIIHHVGGELKIHNTFAWRTGYMHDEVGSRMELSLGAGLSLFRHFDIDWSFIHSPKGSIARNGQWRLGLSVYDLARWSSDDLKWWNE